MGLAVPKLSFGGGADEISFGARFRAWWDGYELSAGAEEDIPDLDDDVRSMRPRGARPMRAGDARPMSPRDTQPGDGPGSGENWTEARRMIAQSIWGDGFVLPGGCDYVRDLVSAFSLDAADAVLEIGAGLGGGSAAIVERFGAHVTCMERDDTLRAVAQHRAEMQDFEERADFQKLTDGLPDLRQSFYAAALVRETLCAVEDKEEFLSKVIESLKPEGRLVVTDLIFAPDADCAELDLWRQTEGRPVYPCEIDAVERCFAENDVVSRGAQDETDLYRSMVVGGCAKLQERLNASFDRALAAPLLDEIELWARRVAAIDAGALRYVRFVGVKGDQAGEAHSAEGDSART